MRLVIVVATLLLIASVPPAHADWSLPCFHNASVGASDGVQLRIIRNLGASASWELSTTVPTTLTLTTVLTTTNAITVTATPLLFTPYIITPRDIEARITGNMPFTLYECEPGFRPHTFAPLLINSAAVR